MFCDFPYGHIPYEIEFNQLSIMVLKISNCKIYHGD